MERNGTFKFVKLGCERICMFGGEGTIGLGEWDQLWRWFARKRKGMFTLERRVGLGVGNVVANSIMHYLYLPFSRIYNEMHCCCEEALTDERMTSGDI